MRWKLVPGDVTHRMVATALDAACAHAGTHINWKPMEDGIKASFAAAPAPDDAVIERVAKWCAGYSHSITHNCTPWHLLTEADREEFRADAKAILTALEAEQ